MLASPSVAALRAIRAALAAIAHPTYVRFCRDVEHCTAPLCVVVNAAPALLEVIEQQGEALRSVCRRTDREGQPCYCAVDRDTERWSHSERCNRARAALALTTPPTGDT